MTTIRQGNPLCLLLRSRSEAVLVGYLRTLASVDSLNTEDYMRNVCDNRVAAAVSAVNVAAPYVCASVRHVVTPRKAKQIASIAERAANLLVAAPEGQ